MAIKLDSVVTTLHRDEEKILDKLNAGHPKLTGEARIFEKKAETGDIREMGGIVMRRGDAHIDKAKTVTTTEPAKPKHKHLSLGARIRLHFKHFAEKVRHAFHKVGEAFKALGHKIGHAFHKLGQDIKHGFQHFGQMVKHGIKGIIDTIGGKKAQAKAEFSKAKTASKALKHDIVDGAKQVGTIAKFVGPLVGAVAAAFIPVAGEALDAMILGGEAAAITAETSASTADIALSAATTAGRALAQTVVKEAPKRIVKELGKEGFSQAKDYTEQNYNVPTPKLYAQQEVSKYKPNVESDPLY